MTSSDPGEADPKDSPGEAAFSATEVRHRAAAGAILVAFRGIALQILGIVSSVVLARLLSPHDFGIVAIGVTVLTVGSFMATTGVGSALVRQAEPPSRRQLGAVSGFQLTVSLVIAGLATALAAPFGQVGGVVAVMASALPFLAIRSPAGIVLERDLQYRPIVTAEVLENVCYYAWAIVTAALGWGVWSLATAAVVRTCIGSLALARLSPVGLVRPVLSWTLLKPILGFGARVQGTSMLNLVRDEGLALSTAGIGGVATLGLWDMTGRLLAPAALVFDAISRVSFPAMSRLLALGESVRLTIEQAIRVSAMAMGLLLTPLVGAAPALIPAVFGSRWAEAAHGLPPAAFGLMIIVPISVSTGGYLTAAGTPGTLLRGAALHTVAQFAVALPLLPIIGIWALGLGVAASSLVEACVLAPKTKQMTGVRFVGGILPPLLAASASASVGWLYASQASPTLPTAIAAFAGTELLFLVLMGILQRATLRETVRMVLRAVRATGRRPAPA